MCRVYLYCLYLCFTPIHSAPLFHSATPSPLHTSRLYSAPFHSALSLSSPPVPPTPHPPSTPHLPLRTSKVIDVRPHVPVPMYTWVCIYIYICSLYLPVPFPCICIQYRSVSYSKRLQRHHRRRSGDSCVGSERYVRNHCF